MLVLGLIAALGIGFVIGMLVAEGGKDAVTTTVTTGASAAEEEKGESEGESFGEGSCIERGIDTAERKEGTCSQEGHKYAVVDRQSTLEMETLDAKLLGIRKNKTLSSDLGSETASGIFVTFELSITNRTHTPATFEEGQCWLYIDENVYTQDFEVQNGIEQQSFLWQGQEIQPQNSQVGTVTFDVPSSVLTDLEKGGNLDFGNFGSEGEEGHEIGTIRTYQ